MLSGASPATSQDLRRRTLLSRARHTPWTSAATRSPVEPGASLTLPPTQFPVPPCRPQAAPTQPTRTATALTASERPTTPRRHP